MTKKQILIIEDEIDIANPIRFALEEKGYDVSLATDGEEGLKRLKMNKPDLLVLDLMLPGIPGEEVCRQVRREERNEEKSRNMPIVILTAKDTDADKVVGKVIGANHYITKPFDMKELLAKIKSLL